MLAFLLPQHHELFLHLAEIHVDAYDFDRNVQQLHSNKSNDIPNKFQSYILLLVIDELNQNLNGLKNFDKLQKKNLAD